MVVQEFERKLEECLSVTEDALGQEGGEAVNESTSAESQQTQRTKRRGKGKTALKHAPTRIKRGGRAGGRGRRDSSSEESEDSDFENRIPAGKNATRRPVESEETRTPTTRGTKKPPGVTKVINDSDTSGETFTFISRLTT